MSASPLKFDEEYCLEIFERLAAVDSTTGQYEEIQKLVCQILDEIGASYQITRKGGVIAPLGEGGDPAVVTAHLDDLGLMVRHVNSDGTLKVCPIGGLLPFYCIAANVRVHTRDGKIYTGTVRRVPSSTHVSGEELRKAEPDFRKNVCATLDEEVKSAADVAALGIAAGDFIALEPETVIRNGFIKSRFIDDKACAAALLALIRAAKQAGVSPNRKVYMYFAMYEEIGHGTTWLPEDTKDVIAVDIAPTGPEQTSDEHKVSIFALDSRFPFHNGLTNELRRTAIESGVDWVVDVFTPAYGTDADASVLAGYDVRHAAVGPGTSNTHGYERTHVSALKNTHDLLAAYLFN